MAQAASDRAQNTDAVLASWRQGDVILSGSLSFFHLADLSKPLTPEAVEVADELRGTDGDDWAVIESDAVGFIVLTQSCDLVREFQERPYVEVAPLVEVQPPMLETVRRLKRPGFAYVPALADRCLVADLDRTMTVEKSVLAALDRIPGVTNDGEASAFARALARKRDRFAFPNAFNMALGKFQERLERRTGKDNDEGRHVDALVEIRVAARPHWDADVVECTVWLIKGHDPDPPHWQKWTDEWATLIDQNGACRLDGPLRVVWLEDMKASEYVASHHLDLDQLSSTVRTNRA